MYVRWFENFGSIFIILEIVGVYFGNFGDFSQEGCYFKLFWRILGIFWPFLKSKGFFNFESFKGHFNHFKYS